MIYAGDKVCIPESCNPFRKPAKCDGELLRKVDDGDTLYKMALANNFRLRDLIIANAQLGPNFDLIFKGDEVCKPKNCGTFEVEEEVVEAEPKFECVVEYNEAVEGVTVEIATDYGNSVVVGNSGEGAGYETAASLEESSASSMVASIVLVLGAVAMFAI
jgi:hypothetical protein